MCFLDPAESGCVESEQDRARRASSVHGLLGVKQQGNVVCCILYWLA